MILGYHNKPSEKFRGKSIFGVYFGVELEVEVLRPSFLEIKSDKVLNCFEESFIITKYDNSITNGFEICTVPASLTYHKKAWDSFFKEGRSGLKGYKTPTCGMHVHISRAPLTNLQIGKMLVFIYSPANRKFIQQIAQRESNTYSEFITHREITDGLRRGFNRHTAINLLNSKTIEIRIFKSNLNPNHFFKNLEFCHALVNFTWPGKFSIRESKHWKFFVNFIGNNKDIYPNLFNFLVESKYLSAERHFKPIKVELPAEIQPKSKFSAILKRKTHRQLGHAVGHSGYPGPIGAAGYSGYSGTPTEADLSTLNSGTH